MGAWKLRAIVYGMLAAVAVLVLLQSRSAHAPAAPERVRLAGRTAQDETVRMSLEGRRIVSFDVAVGGRCSGGSQWWEHWFPSTKQGNVSYRRSGRDFIVHEWPDSRIAQTPGTRADLYMRGTIRDDGRSVAGRVWYTAAVRNATCASGAIPFRADKP